MRKIKLTKQDKFVEKLMDSFRKQLKDTDFIPIKKYLHSGGVKISFKQRSKKILFIMGTLDHDYPLSAWRNTFKILFKTLKKFPTYKLLIKWRDDMRLIDLVNLIANEVDYHNFIICKDKPFKKIDNYKIVNGADIMIVTESTMAFDGMLAGKPVISLYVEGIGFLPRFLNSPLIKTTYNQKQLEKVIKEAV